MKNSRAITNNIENKSGVHDRRCEIRIYYDMINTNISRVHNKRCKLPTIKKDVLYTTIKV